ACELANTGDIREIARETDAVPGCGQLRGRGIAVRGGARRDEHRSAGLYEPARDAEADASRPASYQGHGSTDIEQPCAHVLSSPCDRRALAPHRRMVG